MLADDDAGDADSLVATILADVGRHRGEAPQQDDVTVLALVAR